MTEIPIWVDILLCLLGIYWFFMRRFMKRKDKTTQRSLKFWFKDNWPELTSSVALIIAIMVLIHLPSTIVDITKPLSFLPFDLKILGKPALSLATGMGITGWFYGLFRTKKGD